MRAKPRHSSTNESGPGCITSHQPPPSPASLPSSDHSHIDHDAIRAQRCWETGQSYPRWSKLLIGIFQISQPRQACKYAQLFTKAASTLLPYSSMQHINDLTCRYFLQDFSNPWWRCWKLAIWHFYFHIMELPRINYCYNGGLILWLPPFLEVTAPTFSSSPEIVNVAYSSLPRQETTM